MNICHRGVARSSLSDDNHYFFTMLREFLIGLAGLVILAIVLDLIFARLDDPREPPRVSPGVPLIGHLIGFLYNGFEYYNILR